MVVLTLHRDEPLSTEEIAALPPGCFPVMSDSDVIARAELSLPTAHVARIAADMARAVPDAGLSAEERPTAEAVALLEAGALEDPWYAWTPPLPFRRPMANAHDLATAPAAAPTPTPSPPAPAPEPVTTAGGLVERRDLSFGDLVAQADEAAEGDWPSPPQEWLPQRRPDPPPADQGGWPTPPRREDFEVGPAPELPSAGAAAGGQEMSLEELMARLSGGAPGAGDAAPAPMPPTASPPPMGGEGGGAGPSEGMMALLRRMQEMNERDGGFPTPPSEPGVWDTDERPPEESPPGSTKEFDHPVMEAEPEAAPGPQIMPAAEPAAEPVGVSAQELDPAWAMLASGEVEEAAAMFQERGEIPGDLAHLVGMFASEQGEVVALGCRVAGWLGWPGGARLLQRATSHHSSEARMAAVKALGRLGSPETEPILHMLTMDPDPTVGRAAQRALRGPGGRRL